jgi:hypothetical protein
VIKPARSLASLVKEARRLLNTAQEQGIWYLCLTKPKRGRRGVYYLVCNKGFIFGSFSGLFVWENKNLYFYSYSRTGSTILVDNVVVCYLSFVFDDTNFSLLISRFVWCYHISLHTELVATSTWYYVSKEAKAATIFFII